MLLQPYRVLDLTTRDGGLCGQILGDLGADVIQIEPPGGAVGRQSGPFVGDRPDPEASLSWWAYARGKRSVELDIDRDRDTFLELVKRADFLIEAEPVGSLDARGLGADVLRSVNPALIHVSMTPFGRTGPKARWAATDLTLLASAGPLGIAGDADRPPVRISVPQAWHHAAAEAAAGALVALHERHRSGLGQRVEVAVQQAAAIATQGWILSSLVHETRVPRRSASGPRAGDVVFQFTYPAKDGYVAVTHLFGATIGPATRRLMDYVYDEGFCDAATRDKDWVGYDAALLDGREPLAEFERVKACVAACTRSKTKAELLRVALERRLLVAPVSTIADVVGSEQFASRDYFQQPRGEGAAAALGYPGPFAKFSATPLEVRQRPPRIGEHTADLLDEIARVPPIAATARRSPRELPLAGVKVLDFMWAMAGPAATRILADFGATVVRVESSTRLDVCRTLPPYMNGEQAVEGSAIFHTLNAGKRMLTLDLTRPEGREVVLDLVRWADVVAESFSPRAMKSFGLDYERLRTVNPKLIMLSTCLMGQTGPLAQFAGYGNLAAALLGFSELAGWPDRPPAGPYGAYTDYVAPRFNAIAVLAALEHRHRTGQGQHIDLSQAEAAMHFLTPAILDYAANGRVQSRQGNDDPYAAPHGAYPAAGEDRHVAIACETDAQWRGLCRVVPGLDANDERFRDRASRAQHRDAIDARIRAFTRRQSAESIEAALQNEGVPAAVVQTIPELVRDPQLVHQGHFVALPHAHGGHTSVEASRIRLSDTPACVDRSAPTFARDQDFVLRELLGYDEARIDALARQGVLK